MNQPNITWRIKKYASEDYEETENFYAGSFDNKYLAFELEIWNNRYGTQQVEDLEDFSLEFVFDHVEDSALIKYFTFTFNNEEIIPTQNGLVGTVKFPDNIILSGNTNDGTESATLNYLRILVEITIPENVNIKTNDLKSMTFNIVRL